MKHNLIIPAAGLSTRFSNVRPKWMLTHPSGDMMLISGIRGIDLKLFTNIYFVFLKKHIDEYFKTESNLYNAFKTQLDEESYNKLKIIILEETTKSQPETVVKAIEVEKIEGTIFLKDCDDYFEGDFNENLNDNFICVYNLAKSQKINAANKSYVSVNDLGLVTNIIEKKVISDTFCCGGYGFKSAKEYVNTYEKIKMYDNLYTSHIIYKMILDNSFFKIKEVDQYCDWGTLDDWKDYIKSFSTFFIDLDGVLVENSAEFFPPYWGTTSGIKENIDVINNLYKNKKAKVIITTSRKKEYKDITIKQLENEGILYHDIIFDLPNCKRILVNDYGNTNPYPSCLSINLKRNENNLKNFL